MDHSQFTLIIALLSVILVLNAIITIAVADIWDRLDEAKDRKVER